MSNPALLSVALLTASATESIQRAKVITTGRSRRKEWVRINLLNIFVAWLTSIQSYHVKVRAFVPLSLRASGNRLFPVEELRHEGQHVC